MTRKVRLPDYVVTATTDAELERFNGAFHDGTGPANHVGETVRNRSCGSGYRLLTRSDQQA